MVVAALVKRVITAEILRVLRTGASLIKISVTGTRQAVIYDGDKL